MPNYNNGPYLEDCLNSIFSQSLQEFSLIIIDDFSSDNSVEIIKKWNDPRIVLIERKINGGIVAALNDGLDVVQTEYIIRHDGDDLMHPERIEKLVNYMDLHPEIGVCSSNIQTFGSFTEKIISGEHPEMNKANLIFLHNIGHAASIFRTSVFSELNVRYSDQYPLMEDYDLFYRIKDNALTTSLPEFLYFYRVQERHSNQHQVELKALTLKQFYVRVLSDLGMEPNSHDVEVHYEIAKNVQLTVPLRNYISHVNLLKTQNKIKKIFPEQELNQLLEHKLKGVVYRLIDQNRIGWLELMWYSLLFKTSFIRYRMAKKLKRKQ